MSISKDLENLEDALTVLSSHNAFLQDILTGKFNKYLPEGVSTEEVARDLDATQTKIIAHVLYFASVLRKDS